MAPLPQVPQTKSSIVWAKIRNDDEPAFLNINICVTWCDDVILFRNLQTDEEIYYRASGYDKGDGVATISCHRNLPIFAFSELTLRPRIFCLSYPDFKHVAILKSNHYERYVSIRFSDTEYLFTLSGLPNYSLEIWNWRQGKLLGSIDTGVNSPEQVLRLSRSSPSIVGQYAADWGIFNVWEIHLSMEQALFVRRPTTIPFLNREARLSFVFGMDSNIYMADNIGNLHTIIPSVGVAKLLWAHQELPGPRETLIATYKGGFAIYLSIGFLAYVKKQDGVYTMVWQVQTPGEFIMLRTINNLLYGFTVNGTPKILDKSETSGEDVTNQEPVEESDAEIRSFELIYPVGEYAVIDIGHNKLDLMKLSNGTVVATTNIRHIVCIASHPQYPFLAIGDQMGAITILSYFKPKTPNILTQFNLSETWIDLMRFTPNGDILVVSDRYGDFYIVTGQIGGRLDISAHFNFDYPDLCFCAQKVSELLHVLVLSSMEKDFDIEMNANKAHRVTVNFINHQVTETTLTLPDRYTSLSAMPSNPKQYIGAPYMKRDIHILEMHADSIKVVEVVVTFNQLPYLELFTDMNYIVTWGMEGIVSILDVETKKMDAVYFAQNRYSHRMRNARVDPSRKYSVSIGSTGSLKCYLIEPNHSKSSKIQELQASLQNEAMISLFTKPTRSFAPSGKDADKTWLELKRRRDTDREKAEFRKEKQEIYDDFLDLKQKLNELIDHNEEWPENERLPLQNFNLSKEWAESLFEMARQERELEDRAMKAYVADQNRITQWIIDNTWNRMSIQGCKVRGIFSSICCENYPLMHADRTGDDDLKKVLLWLSTENMVAKIDKFQPWIPRTPGKMMEKLAQSPDYIDEESGFKHSGSSSETEVPDLTAERFRQKRIKYALSGTSTHTFIDPISNRYDQMDVVTFEQTFAEKILGQMDMYNLRLFFNKEFNTLYKFKEDQMEQVKKRNDRLRTIQDELNILALLKGTDEHYSEIIIDPEYKFDEQPEKIIKVENYEVQVAPYISPSRQKLLDEEAHQLELKRLALLADDFRERALITMMDGVLEKRWEDEIKKTPPPPDCVKSGKKHEDFSKDDIRAVSDYEAQLRVLQAERDKYRLMLLEEKTKLFHLQGEMITKFNMKCASLFMMKHQVDAAIKQEELKLLRNAIKNYQRILHKRKELDYMLELTQLKKEIENFLDTLEDLEKRVSDCRARYDQLQSRDRMLDRQFKSQFGESAPPVIVDQAYKIFKKRPKWIPRGWATAAILQDVANRIATKNYSKSGAPLPEECYEFLTLVESLENISSAPNSITPHLWNFLCQLRRHKMDSEFRLKAQGLQLAEAEATLNGFTKELAHKKDRIIEIDKEREALRQVYYNNLRNRYVQIVMPRGIIEVPLTGHMDDFKGSILVHQSDIDDINGIIKKAGEIKLRTMNRSAVFRRKIIYKEWEHRMLQMEVKNMQDYLDIIEKCKVTKEVQMYLKRKDLGLADDLNQTALNREIESTRSYLKKTLDDINAIVEKVSRQLEIKRRENKFLDGEIARINVDVTEQNLLRDFTMEEKERTKQMERMTTVVERGKLIRRVQAQHAQILELATMLELQRLRTFPTLDAAKQNAFP